MDQVDWPAVVSGLVQWLFVALAGGMLAWLRSSYIRFKSMDESLKSMRRIWRRSLAKLKVVEKRLDEHAEKIESLCERLPPDGRHGCK